MIKVRSLILFVPFSYSAILGNLAYAYTRRWKPGPKPKKSLPKRVAILTAAGILYLSIWSSILIFNVKFEGKWKETYLAKA